MTLVKPDAFEPVHREPPLPWREVVGKNLDDFLTLLYVSKIMLMRFVMLLTIVFEK